MHVHLSILLQNRFCSFVIYDVCMRRHTQNQFFKDVLCYLNTWNQLCNQRHLKRTYHRRPSISQAIRKNASLTQCHQRQWSAEFSFRSAKPYVLIFFILERFTMPAFQSVISIYACHLQPAAWSIEAGQVSETNNFNRCLVFWTHTFNLFWPGVCVCMYVCVQV